MSNSEKDNSDASELTSSLPASAAALSAEDRAGLVNPLKDKPQDLAVQDTGIMENLSPAVRQRVEALKEIQSQHDTLEPKLLKEREELEAKYHALYETLYTKRYEIVNGVVEVEGVTDTSLGQDKANEDKGVPDFWLTAMKTNEILAEEITDRDEDALEFLKDIKWSKIDNPKGFRLEFFFDINNPLFMNSILTKTYHDVGDHEPILHKSIGTQIEWYPGTCLTQKFVKKMPLVRNARPIIKTKKCRSFFNFFSPSELPEDKDNIDEDEAEELQNLMEQDYEIGSIIRDKIIPHAVSWFTGEAVEGGELDEEDEDDDKKDDDEDEEGVKFLKKKNAAGEGEQEEGEQECKQQ